MYVLDYFLAEHGDFLDRARPAVSPCLKSLCYQANWLLAVVFHIYRKKCQTIPLKHLSVILFPYSKLIYVYFQYEWIYLTLLTVRSK